MKMTLLSSFLGAAVCLSVGTNQTFAQAKTNEASKTAEKSVKTETAKEENKTTKTEGNELAVIKTTEGEMILEFWSDAAPKHVENFKTLAKKGFYDGTAFHRVIPGFMIQGGDPNTKDESAKATWGGGGPGYTINAEFNSHKHVRGILSMARTPDPNSAGSQFFICHADAPSLDGQYTVFGKLIKGFDVLDKIVSTPTEPPNRPIKRMGITSVKIVPASSVKESSSK